MNAPMKKPGGNLASSNSLNTFDSKRTDENRQRLAEHGRLYALSKRTAEDGLRRFGGSVKEKYLRAAVVRFAFCSRRGITALDAFRVELDAFFSAKTSLRMGAE